MTDPAILHAPTDISAFDWWTLALHFVASVAWPILIFVVLAALLVPRVQGALSSGLSKLAKTFKSFKLGGVEAILHDEQIQETLEKNDVSLSASKVVDKSLMHYADQKIANEPYDQPTNVNVSEDPRIIALEAYNRLESCVADIVEKLEGTPSQDLSIADNKKYYGSSKPRRMWALLAILEKQNLVREPEIDSVFSLRRIRNNIAHNTAAVEMTVATALSYRDQCQQIIESIHLRWRNQTDATANDK